VTKTGKKSTKKTTRRSKKPTSRKQSIAVHQKQWDLPAGYRLGGTQLATLREMIDPQSPTLSLSELTPEQMAELVAQRIEAQKEFKIAMIGAGLIDKNRAVAEVRAQTKVGKVLMEIEQQMIHNLIERAQKQPTQKKKN
jgi:hypothetical protein